MAKLAASVLVRIVARLTSPRATMAVARVLGVTNKPAGSDVVVNDDARILVVRPDGIGDVIMTGPMLRELRNALPRSVVTLVVAPRAFNVVETCPYVDRVVTVDIAPPRATTETWWRPLIRRMAAFKAARLHFRGMHFDIALVPRWGVDSHEASILAYLSGASQRVGYSEHVSSLRAKRNGGYDELFTSSICDRSVKHEVERNLGILTALQIQPTSHLGLESWLSDGDVAFAEASSVSATDRPIAAIGLGAGSPRRMWPVERFAAVGRWAYDQGSSLVVVGGAADERRASEFVARVDRPVLDLTNRATLREAAAVLERCSLFYGNDAGTMHLAAAAGVPVVEISCHPKGGDDLHANSPVRFGPWGVPHRIVQPDFPSAGCIEGCRALTPHCILNIPVAAVVRAITSLVAKD